jgi:hypothetical protein
MVFFQLNAHTPSKCDDYESTHGPSWKGSSNNMYNLTTVASVKGPILWSGLDQLSKFFKSYIIVRLEEDGS